MHRPISATALPSQLGPIRLVDVRHWALRFSRADALCATVVAAGVVLYTVAYSSLGIAAFRAGRTYFDLAAFEQSFWNSAHGRLFLGSLEVVRPDLTAQMSHLGRHVSPIFLLLLPIYVIYQHPSTLLVLQSLALGGAAIPLYLFARERLKSAIAAMVIALLYLANPAIHDVNLVNEFHELSFVIPLIFLAFCALDAGRWVLYWIAVVGMLAVKEDVALTVCALGIYAALVARQRRLGLATFAAGASWFVIATMLVIPAFRGPGGPIPFLGYDYLGHGLSGIAGGIVLKPLMVWHVVTAAPKLGYVYWLLMPVSFVALLAPEVLMVAVPATLIVLASTSPLINARFAHYTAPMIPVVFIAAVVAIERIQRLSQRLGRAAFMNGAVAAVLLPSIVGGTAYTQFQLHRFPSQIVSEGHPDHTAAAAIALVEAIPGRASLVVEDHRWLAHAANRRYLYFLFDRSPQADYVLINPSTYPPVTNVPKEVRESVTQRIAQSGDYFTFQCSAGFALYVRKAAFTRDDPSIDCTMMPSAAGSFPRYTRTE